MTKKFLGFFLIALFFLISSCDNELDSTAEFKETPIILALINPDDQEHFIKVYKSFLNDEISAITIAQNPDSIYYTDSIIVSLERASNGQRFFFSKIDGNTIGKPMDEGIFANSPNILYTLNQSLIRGETYRLKFENPLTGKTTFSETKMIDDFQINAPFEGFNFNFATNAKFDVQWRSAAGARLYDVVLRFFYEEWNINNPSDVQTKFLDWRIGNAITSNNVNGGEQLSVNIDGVGFYNFLRGTLSSDPNIRRRVFNENIQIIFTAAGQTLYDFIRINRAQTGITSLQTLPDFTNIEGGLGIFSSRKTKIRNKVGLNSRSIDSLSCGTLTRQLNFVNTTCR